MKSATTTLAAAVVLAPGRASAGGNRLTGLVSGVQIEDGQVIPLADSRMAGK